MGTLLVSAKHPPRELRGLRGLGRGQGWLITHEAPGRKRTQITFLDEGRKKPLESFRTFLSFV